MTAKMDSTGRSHGMLMQYDRGYAAHSSKYNESIEMLQGMGAYKTATSLINRNRVN